MSYARGESRGVCDWHDRPPLDGSIPVPAGQGPTRSNVGVATSPGPPGLTSPRLAPSEPAAQRVNRTRAAAQVGFQVFELEIRCRAIQREHSLQCRPLTRAVCVQVREPQSTRGFIQIQNLIEQSRQDRILSGVAFHEREVGCTEVFRERSLIQTMRDPPAGQPESITVDVRRATRVLMHRTERTFLAIWFSSHSY